MFAPFHQLTASLHESNVRDKWKIRKPDLAMSRIDHREGELATPDRAQHSWLLGLPSKLLTFTHSLVYVAYISR